MATLLLIVIFIDFIGLGIPDSLFGAAWPAIYEEFSLPISYANFVTLIVSGGTILSSLSSAKLIGRFGTSVVTAASTVLTAVALLGFSLSGSFWFLCVCAVPLGLGAGAIDSALNNYVANHYKAAQMNFLHCFYGIGVSLSPFLMSLALSDGGNWRAGYQTMFFVQAAIALLTLVSLPLWFKIKKTENAEDVRSQESFVPLSRVVKISAVRIVWPVFFSSCAIEYTCGNWGSTYLVQQAGMTADAAALSITFYYAGMALGRFLSGIFSGRLSEWKLISVGQGIVLCALIPLFLPLPAAVAAAALFLVGLGNGPVFPNLIHLTPRNFGKENSQAAMGTQMAASYLGIMLMPSVFGVAAQYLGLGALPYYLLILAALMIFFTFWLKRSLKSGKNA